MRIYCIYNIRFLHLLGIRAITLYPLILFAGSQNQVSEKLYRHELEHIYQVKRLGIVRFYFSYLQSYLKLRWNGKGHQLAYWEIPFEVEARASESQQLTRHELDLIKGFKV